MNMPVIKARGETEVAPKSANKVATTPTIGKEKAANPLVLRNEKSKYVNGNAA